MEKPNDTPVQPGHEHIHGCAMLIHTTSPFSWQTHLPNQLLLVLQNPSQTFPLLKLPEQSQQKLVSILSLFLLLRKAVSSRNGHCHWLQQNFVVQLLSHVRLFVTPGTAAHQASLSFTVSQSPPKLMSIESVMPSNHLILCLPLLLPP